MKEKKYWWFKNFKNIKKWKKKANKTKNENSRKVYHFFFGSLAVKGYLNVYIT